MIQFVFCLILTSGKTWSKIHQSIHAWEPKVIGACLCTVGGNNRTCELHTERP